VYEGWYFNFRMAYHIADCNDLFVVGDCLKYRMCWSPKGSIRTPEIRVPIEFSPISRRVRGVVPGVSPAVNTVAMSWVSVVSCWMFLRLYV
jgi:hypothetical protein